MMLRFCMSIESSCSFFDLVSILDMAIVGIVKETMILIVRCEIDVMITLIILAVYFVACEE